MPINSRSIAELSEQLRRLTDLLAEESSSNLTVSQASRARKTISSVLERLQATIDKLDPIKQPDAVFDPSNPAVAGRIAGIAMIAQPRTPLKNVTRFYGSGVYAIYYNGKFPVYRAIARREHPIYVGKADPSDPAAKSATAQGDRLSRRLKDHQKNISKASSTLRLEDFEFRSLVVQSGWQGAAESYLIDLFKPIWNSEVKICYGFGKHGDDPGTRANLRSPWDTLHPGRDWAHRDKNMRDARSSARIQQEINRHLEEFPPVRSLDEILKRLLKELRFSK